MVTKTIFSESIIKHPDTSVVPYYCTETEWRDYTGFTNTSEFSSAAVATHLENATEQIKKDAFHMVRFELVTKDDSNRRFTARRYWGNRYGRDTSIRHDLITKYDLQVWEADTTSSVAASLALQGTRINRLMYPIPYEGITEIDPLNCFFKLSDDYPTQSNRQIYVTYWVCGKPLDEINYDLKRACFEYTTYLALKKLKTKRLKSGIVSYTMGKQTVNRDEKAFDELIKSHYEEYHKWTKWFRPFIGRRCRIGRMETTNARRWTNRY